MKPLISILTPGIRVDRWINMYHSLCQAVHCPFELIMVGPYQLPSELANLSNVKFVKDYGSPIRCSNIGLTVAEGKYFTWNADDGIFRPGVLQRAVNHFESMPYNIKNILITMYTEGGNTFDYNYFKLCNAYPRVPYTSDDWWIMNCGIFFTDYFIELGGWDCRFETLAFAHADLAIRAQRDGCVAQIYPEVTIDVGHMPGDSGDHAPIFHAHHGHDEPLYIAIHNDPTNANRVKINLDNWKQSPLVWARRFRQNGNMVG